MIGLKKKKVEAIEGAIPENGDLVRDSITGFSGIVICKAINLYNCDRVGIQCQDLTKDETIHDTQWFDVPQVEVLEKAKLKAIPVEANDVGDVHYFDTVQDQITKLEGTVIGYGIWLNGCIRLDMAPKISEDKPNEIPDAFWIHPKRLKVIEKADNRVALKIQGPKVVKKEKQQVNTSPIPTTGGPMDNPRMQKQRMC